MQWRQTRSTRYRYLDRRAPSGHLDGALALLVRDPAMPTHKVDTGEEVPMATSLTSFLQTPSRRTVQDLVNP